METTFKTTIKAFGNNTGIVVPQENIEELNAGKKPAVKVSIDGYEYQSSVAVMDGLFLVSLSKAHREKSGIKGGDEVTVTLTLETANRIVEVPQDFHDLLVKHQLLETFEAQSYSNRKEMIRQIVESKKDETRIKRSNQIVEQLLLLRK